MTKNQIAQIVAKVVAAEKHSKKSVHATAVTTPFNPHGITGISLTITYKGKKAEYVPFTRVLANAKGKPYTTNIGFALPSDNILGLSTTLYVKRSLVAGE